MGRRFESYFNTAGRKQAKVAGEGLSQDIVAKIKTTFRSYRFFTCCQCQKSQISSVQKDVRYFLSRTTTPYYRQ